MNELFGFTRDVVKSRYALRTPNGFVPSHLPGWSNCVCVIQISPAMGANFSQFLITFNKNGAGRGNSGNTEFFIFVLSGKCASTGKLKRRHAVRWWWATGVHSNSFG